MKIRFSILLVAFTLQFLNVFAQIEKIQTAIIYQFTRQIEWCPSGKQGSFTIGVLSEDASILNELNSLQGRRVGEQAIEVKKLLSVQEAKNVNIVFVTKSKIDDLQQVLSGLGSSCTLVIADKPGAAGMGAGISFVEEGGRIQFEINKSFAEKHSLKVSNDLIKLAKNVF